MKGKHINSSEVCIINQYNLRAMRERSRGFKSLYLLSIFPCPLKTVTIMELESHHHKKMINGFQFETNSALINCCAVPQIKKKYIINENRAQSEHIRVKG